jgi:cation:H+ antiporter
VAAVALAYLAFIGGAVVILATSWLLVTRLERVGERFGLTEALLGVVAALGADAPEISSSVSALYQHQRAIGAGVVIGSNAFNLAALLGLGALVSGFITLHRRVVVLAGVIATWIGVCCVGAETRAVSDVVGLFMACAVFIPYLVVLGLRRSTLTRAIIPRRFAPWLVAAVHEEELELDEVIRPLRGGATDAAVALGALVVVVLSSVAMERGASHLGHHFHIANAVIGGIILAAVTSLPNAVAAVYLASRGRGAAALSTAMTSNNLNVIAGLLIPGAVVGLAVPSIAGTLTATSYLALTVVVLALAYAKSGLNRIAGWIIVATYGAFVVALIAVT